MVRSWHLQVGGQVHNKLSMHDQIVSRLLQVSSKHFFDSVSLFVHQRDFWLTFTSHVEIDDISDSNIDDAEEALVLLFELLLVEYLYG